MPYHECHPGPFLAASVECIWTSTLSPGQGTNSLHRLLPNGCIDLIFDLTQSTGRRVCVVGMMTRPLLIKTQGAADILGVRFRPGRLGMFGIPASELTDRRIDLQNFWGHKAIEFWHRLGESKRQLRLSILQKEILAQQQTRTVTDDAINKCVQWLQAGEGGACIDHLENMTGLSGRQVERRFLRNVGIGPNLFGRLARFKRVVAAAEQAQPPRWINLAAELGYADQSHLVREFKTFAGITPTEYRNSLQRMLENVGFVQDASVAGG